MVDYIETYELLGGKYSIEDLETPGNHFMPDSAKGRFQCWWNGCGIGHADTIEDARTILQNVLASHIKYKLTNVTKAVSDIREALPRLMNLQAP